MSQVCEAAWESRPVRRDVQLKMKVVNAHGQGRLMMQTAPNPVISTEPLPSLVRSFLLPTRNLGRPFLSKRKDHLLLSQTTKL